MKNLLLVIALMSGCVTASAEESVCYGTTKKGRLENGVKLPRSGPNFESYSFVGRTFGRTYLHSKITRIVIDTYKRLGTEAPGKLYKYGETGKEEGGSFRPHKTHQNGLSVDFMVPVMDEEGRSVELPTNLFNKWGYDIEFDKNGRYEEYRLDYEAMASHLVALHKTAKESGVKIWRVIFDPKMQKQLFKTKHGRYLIRHLTFSKKRSWVRHDDHYHVDFIVPCKKLNN